MARATPRGWLGFALGVAAACVLFALRSVELTADSLNEVRAIASGGFPPHPHHLGFAPLVRGLYLAVAAVFPACDALAVAQSHNALWAGVAVASAYWILEHGGPRPAAALGALALFASAGTLVLATQVEAYLPAVGCLLLLSALLLRAPRGPAATVAAIALFAAAVLYHQSAVLFALPLVFLVRRWGASGADPAPRWLARYALVAAASGALVLAAYVLASGARSPRGVLGFALTYLEHPNAAWASESNLSPTGVFRLLRSQVRNLLYVPGTFSSAMDRAVVLLALALAGLAGGALWTLARRRRAPHELLVPGAWLAGHGGFFLWFLPGEADHFVQTVFPLVWLAVLVLEAALQRPALRRAGFLAALALLVAGGGWNLARVALPRHRDRGPAYREAAALARLGLVEESLVLADHNLNVHLVTYFGAEATAVPDLLLQRLYRHGALGALAPAIAGRERVVVPLRFVHPDYRVDTCSGWTDAPAWLSFLRWLSAFEAGDGGRPASHAALALAETEGGERYLVLRPGVRVAGDLRALLDALDELAGGTERPFRTAGAARAGP